jgi:HPt (histidine-containing phosphotransfer) domain-containing protein
MKQKDDRTAQGAVDLADLLARVENDHDLLCELIVIFKEDFPRALQSLQESVAREDMKNVQDTSHALKGMLSGLSVMQAAATASRLEQMAQQTLWHSLKAKSRNCCRSWTPMPKRRTREDSYCRR